MESAVIEDVDGNTWLLPDGLVDRATAGVKYSKQVLCLSCEAWAHAGDHLRHSRRCDNGNLQPEFVTPPPALELRDWKGGQRIYGLASEVKADSIVVVNGTAYRIAKLGKTWTSGGHEVRYGYLDTTEAAVLDPEVTQPLDRSAIRHSAAGGTLYRDYDVDDVVEAVRYGHISVSDAMNQDC